jgi:hypothetical protein
MQAQRYAFNGAALRTLQLLNTANPNPMNDLAMGPRSVL